MVAALPVRERKKLGSPGGIVETWEDYLASDDVEFNAAPDVGSYNYIRDLRLAKRRGTLRVVRALLKQRKASS
jgi:hypothetical protein